MSKICKRWQGWPVDEVHGCRCKECIKNGNVRCYYNFDNECVGRRRYSVLEQHIDGSWWYHPGLTFDSKEELVNGVLEHFGIDKNRTYKFIEHVVPFPQNASVSSFDCETFYHIGAMGSDRDAIEIH